jgi:hypothetical protein
MPIGQEEIVVFESPLFDLITWKSLAAARELEPSRDIER